MSANIRHYHLAQRNPLPTAIVDLGIWIVSSGEADDSIRKAIPHFNS
jgi:hypothetical protein